MTKLYLAGPMRGYAAFNFPAFDEAAAVLRRAGYEVFSPADHDRETHGADFADGNTDGDESKAAETHGFSLRDALKADTAWICDNADGIALLPYWHESKGAQAERALGHALGVPARMVAEWLLDAGVVRGA